MYEWPHDKIRTVAFWYICRNCSHEDQWLYTRLLHLHDELTSVVSLQASERPIVSCYIDEGRWFVMTSARMIIFNDNQKVVASPLDLTRWQWGDFKTDLEPRIGTATIVLKDGTSFSFQYETGYASMAPIYYVLFWDVKYPALHNLDVARIRTKAERLSGRQLPY